jgi:hypothetical protein
VVLPNLRYFSLLSLSVTGLFIVYLYNLLRTQLFKILIILTIILDLFLFGKNLAPTINPKIYTSAPETVKLLTKKNEHFRVFHWYIFNLFYKNDWRQYQKSYLDNIGSLPPEFCSVYGISAIKGVDMLGGDYRKINKNPGSKTIDLLGAKYIITPYPLKTKGLKLIYQKADFGIYENKRDVLPRAFITHKAKIIKDRTEILKELEAPHFNPREYIIIEEEVPAIKKKKGSPGSKTKSKAEIVEYQPDEVVIDVKLDRNGFLVLTDNYYPGWKAYVDGKKTKIYKANFALRAIRLSAGEHKVKFIYAPLSFKIGAGITVLTLLFLIAIGLAGKIKMNHRGR